MSRDSAHSSVCITQSQLSCLPALTLKPSDSAHFDDECVINVCVANVSGYRASLNVLVHSPANQQTL